MNASNLAFAVEPQELPEAFGGGGGGGGPHSSRFVCGGAFTPDDAEPTCDGLDAVWRRTQTLPRDEFRRVAMAVMDAVWTQPPPTSQRPILTSIQDLLNALACGWAYNADEGDCLFTVFADIRPFERRGRFAGVGTQAPDGAIIHDGRELVAWRERRWNLLRGPARVKDGRTCSLRAV